VADAVKIPVTVKTRLGWDAGNKIIVDLAEQLQDCGIAALTIHGRTRAQMYTGEADWTLIGEVYIFNLHNLTEFTCKSTEKSLPLRQSL
jgi:tRNA-dihydrouridine synthase B